MTDHLTNKQRTRLSGKPHVLCRVATRAFEGALFLMVRYGALRYGFVIEPHRTIGVGEREASPFCVILTQCVSYSKPKPKSAPHDSKKPLGTPHPTAPFDPQQKEAPRKGREASNRAVLLTVRCGMARFVPVSGFYQTAPHRIYDFEQHRIEAYRMI